MTLFPWQHRTRLPEPTARPVPLAARDVTVHLGGRAVLDGVSIEVRTGEVLALVGPNGAGKSTLLGVLSGDLVPETGDVRWDDRPRAQWTERELALRRAVLQQRSAVGFPFTVLQVVRMGRSPWAGTEREEDDEAVLGAVVEQSDVGGLLHRTFPTLSGGEQSRAALARVLAQDTHVLLLDEPTAALDLGHQEQVLELARDLAATGSAVVVVLHDLGLAAAYADRVALLVDGRLRACGAPEDVLTDDLLTAAYDHPVEVLRHPRTGALLVLPRRDAQPRPLETTGAH